MKNFFYLAIAAVLAVVSCDKNGTDDVDIPVEGSVPANSIAGSDVNIVGKFMEGDVFYYLKEKDNQEGRIDLTVKKVLSSSAIVSLPYYTGKYCVYVDRKDKPYYIGDITVEVTGITASEEGLPGGTVTVKGNGLNPNGKLFAKKADAEPVDLKSTFSNGVITATLPSDIPGGKYELIYEQETGFFITVQESYTIPVVKRLAKVEIKPGKYSYEITYNGKGDPATINGNAVTVSGDEWSYTEKQDKFVYKVKDGRIIELKVNDRVNKIEYDADNHIVQGGNGFFAKYVWKDGNLVPSIFFVYGDKPKANNKKAAFDPFLIYEMAVGPSEYNLIPAAMLGLCGTPSVKMPDMVSDDFGGGEVEYTFDEDGYITGFTTPFGMSASFKYVN